MPESLVSVVIIGKNEGPRLKRCLDSAIAMNDPGGRVEIIYVDSNSTDGSCELAKSYGAKVIVVGSSPPNAAKARNLGWKASNAQFILFLDGDTVLHPDFVKESLKEFVDPNIAIVWGHRREMFPANSIYNRVLDLDWVYPAGPTDFCGGDALIRRDVLHEVDGFDPFFNAGEEPEMCNRIRKLGYTILHVDRPMTGHDLAMTRWSQYWRRAIRAGYAYAQVAHRYWATEEPLWKREVIRNSVRAMVLLGSPVLFGLAALLLGSLLPLLLLVAFWTFLILRTALKVTWKSSESLTRLLYAVHSHFQLIPIFFGQLSYGWDVLRQESRGLIDYKEEVQ